MDSTAIKTLLETGAAQATQLTDGTMCVPQNWQYISTEKFQQFPNRHRRKFTTARLGDLITYCKARCDEDSVAFIDAKLEKVTVIINHGNAIAPAWGDDTATLNLDYTAAFEAFHKLTRNPIKQQTLVDFLEDFGGEGTIIPMDFDGTFMPIEHAITAVRKVTIAARSSATNEVQNTRAARSSMEEIEAHGAGTLPAVLRFYGAPFHGLQPRNINARIAVLTGADTPMLSLRMMAWETHLEQMSTEIEQALRAGLPAEVFVGSSVFPS